MTHLASENPALFQLAHISGVLTQLEPLPVSHQVFTSIWRCCRAWQCQVTVTYSSLNLKPRGIKNGKKNNAVSKTEVCALAFPVRALMVPCVQHCGLVWRRSGENSGGAGWWRRPLTGIGALPRYSRVCMYVGATLRGWNRPSRGYTTTTLLQWTAVKLGAKSGGCCLCNWWKKKKKKLRLSWRNPVLSVFISPSVHHG